MSVFEDCDDCFSFSCLQKCTPRHWYLLITLYFQVRCHISSDCQNVSGWKQWQLWGKTMWLGTEEELLNERRRSDVISPGAKSTGSPSARGKNTKGLPTKKVVFIWGFFLRYSSLVRQSKIARSCWKRRDERVQKRHFGEREGFPG